MYISPSLVNSGLLSVYLSEEECEDIELVLPPDSVTLEVNPINGEIVKARVSGVAMPRMRDLTEKEIKDLLKKNHIPWSIKKYLSGQC